MRSPCAAVTHLVQRPMRAPAAPRRTAILHGGPGGPSVENALSNEAEALKRRSTRIVQSIPLTVTGEDALGNAFKERTSTLIVNCHGCKYLSRHHVPLDSWVTLEILRPAPGEEPLRVRARVTWIQKPRTLNELYQVGVQLETPGNVWGIAFPPQDWFPFPEASAPSLSAPRVPGPVPTKLSTTNAQPLMRVERPLPESRTAAPIAHPVPVASAMRNPSAGAQVDPTLRAAATRILAEQAIPLMQDLRARLNQAAEQALEEAVRSHSQQLVRGAVAQIEEAREQNVAAVREQLGAALQETLQQVRGQFASLIEETAGPLRESFARQLDADLARATSQADTAAGRIDALERSLQERIARAEERLAALQNEIESAAQAARASAEGDLGSLYETARQITAEVRQTLSATVEDAGAQLIEVREQVESAAESAQLASAQRQKELEESADSLRRQANALLNGAEETLAKLRADLQASAEAACAGSVEQLQRRVGELFGEVEARLGQLRNESEASAETARTAQEARLRELEDSAQRLQQQTASVIDEARRIWRHQLESDMALAGSEWNGMLDTAVRGATDRLRGGLEEVEQQSADRVTAQAGERLAAELQGAHDAAKELDRAQRDAAEFLREREEELREGCEQIVRDSAGQAEEYAARLRQGFESAGAALHAKWLEELDTKGTDTIHNVFDYFSKASEWYQKKAQTCLGAVAERMQNETTARLRDEAAEVSRLLASELNHQSLSYAEHTRALFEEAKNELAGRARQDLEELRASTGAAFTAELQGITRQTLEGIAALEQQAREGRARAADESVEQYNQRLTEASRVWMEQSLDVLEGRAHAAIEGFARSTEERLNATLSGLLADFADNLRARLLGIAPQKF